MSLFRKYFMLRYDAHSSCQNQLSSNSLQKGVNLSFYDYGYMIFAQPFKVLK